MKKKKEETALQPREPEVLTPNQVPANRGSPFDNVIFDMLHRFSPNAFATLNNTEYKDLSPKDKATVDKIMQELKPEIEERASELLFFETRDKIVKLNQYNEILDNIKQGKHGRFVRKKGCIYIQFGTGEPQDPITEYIIATT